MSNSILNNVKKKFIFAKEKIKFYNGYTLTPCTTEYNLLNLSPGPTALPKAVLKDVIDEFNNNWTMGVTPLEISHRSPEFLIIKNSCEQLFRDLLKIPNNFSLIWTHGGGHGQFSAVPLNLIKSKEDEPDYIVTGTWSNRSYLEAVKFCKANKISEKEDFTEINSINRNYLIDSIKNSKSEYVYICSNETINGIEFREDGLSIPSKRETNNKKMIVDMSSDILSKNLNWNNIDVAFACAPKNFGFPGSTITIIENCFLTDEYNKHYKNIPSLLDWKLIRESDSFWNTLPVFNIYVTEKILKYYEKIGGLKTIQSNSNIKANMLYTVLDNSKIYEPLVPKNRIERSRMNIPFYIKNKEIMDLFLHNAYRNNIVGLRTKTPFSDSNKPEALRISLYNSVTVDDTIYLVSFMKEFEDFISSVLNVHES